MFIEITQPGFKNIRVSSDFVSIHHTGFITYPDIIPGQCEMNIDFAGFLNYTGALPGII